MFFKYFIILLKIVFFGVCDLDFVVSNLFNYYGYRFILISLKYNF